MNILEKNLDARCEWCKHSALDCSIIIYGEEKAMIICKTCLESLRRFLEEIDVKEAEVWVEGDEDT